MQLQTITKTVTEHTFTLNDADLARYMEDPWAFREDVLSQHKNGGGNGIATPKKRTKRTARDFTIGRKPKKAKANGAAPKHARRVGAAFPKVPCSKCKRPIAQPQLARHESKCTGAADGAASDTN